MSALIDPAWVAGGMGIYGMSALAAGSGQVMRKPGLKQASVALLSGGLLLNAVIIGIMWVNAGRPPFKTLYETLLLYPFCIAFVGLLLFALHRVAVIIPIAAAGAVACLIGALMRPDLDIVLLPPALQSPWFVPHVVTYFVAYAALSISALLASIALFKHYTGRAPAKPIVGGSPDDVVGHAAVFGFVCLTAGLAMGSAWGKSAWGEYWAWDAKENWALITWLAYLTYLHAQMLPAWRGSRALWLNVACFAAVLFTYLGMHLLPTASSSLHVYQ
jgi:ABC-type transport system involved in cytochrome c biogenesis permease subunit